MDSVARGSPGRARIVVGIDGSEPSKEALRWAGRLAAAEAATIEVVGVWQLPSSVGWATVSPDFALADEFKIAVDKAVDQTFDERPGDLTVRCVEGDPAAVLLDASRDALMVVVGSRGHGGFMGLLLGSVSAKVAENATCPVLVVHARAD
ncbi:MAG TPA: universal stress protein [Jatrophihabitans sp.]|jgi:nucleotide-binding universal stress UspA family protein|nr:universal stress protein [Jatrophihabitans sp.]